MKKFTWHFAVKYDGRWFEGTYGNATREELQRYVEAYFPAGDGREQGTLDIASLTIIGYLESDGNEE